MWFPCWPLFFTAMVGVFKSLDPLLLLCLLLLFCWGPPHPFSWANHPSLLSCPVVGFFFLYPFLRVVTLQLSTRIHKPALQGKKQTQLLCPSYICFLCLPCLTSQTINSDVGFSHSNLRMLFTCSVGMCTVPIHLRK